MAYEQQRRAFEGLQRTVATLGEVLSKPLPQLPEANLTRMAASGGVTAIFTKAGPALVLACVLIQPACLLALTWLPVPSLN